jgi:hypothetical protein
VDRVFAWDGNSWDIHSPGSSFFRIDEVLTGQGLWIFVSGPQAGVWRQLRVAYQSTALQPGWQLLAWPGPTVATAETLRFTPAEVLSVFGWDPLGAGFLTYQTALPGAASLESLQHLEAVWILVGAPGGNWPGP